MGVVLVDTTIFHRRYHLAGYNPGLAREDICKWVFAYIYGPLAILTNILFHFQGLIYLFKLL